MFRVAAKEEVGTVSSLFAARSPSLSRKSLSAAQKIKGKPGKIRRKN
jgi:hypothetical protein